MNISQPNQAVKHFSRFSHQNLYKSPSRNTTTTNNECDPNGESPSWRNAYKKRCFDEFKKSRLKLVNKFRSLQVNEGKTKFKDYIEDELEKICLLEAKTNPDLISIDEAIVIYKQIQTELIPNSDQDEEIIKELLDAENLNNSIVCPVCQKAKIVQEGSVLYCKNTTSCILRIDLTETKMSLNDFAERLENAVKLHPCNEIPTFQFKSHLGKSDLILLSQLSSLPINESCFLLMCCENCQFMHSIL